MFGAESEFGEEVADYFDPDPTFSEVLVEEVVSCLKAGETLG